MRLHHLSVTAFGPFAGSVEVDLDVTPVSRPTSPARRPSWNAVASAGTWAAKLARPELDAPWSNTSGGPAPIVS